MSSRSVGRSRALSGLSSEDAGVGPSARSGLTRQCSILLRVEVGTLDPIAELSQQIDTA